MSLQRLLSVALVASLAPLAAGCTSDQELAQLDGTLDTDGYALFAVDNQRQQRNDVTVRIRNADPGATYVLFYSPRAPRNVGWFQFDPRDKSRCGGDIGAHCEVDGFGFMVDVQTAPDDGASDRAEVTLRDDRCGCDGDHDDDDWTGHWAVMRVERTNRTNPITIDVWAKRIRSYASEPKIMQLQ
jgi:hypothetical protein